MIEIEELRKSYGEAIAVDGITLAARAGEIFGLLGPNGAGKTTTVGCICGLLTPSAGRVKVGGHDVVRDGAAARAQLGVVPQELALYDDLSARENLAYWGGAQGLRNPKLRERIQQVLELAGLEDRAREPVKRFSGGMKRRLNFACGILHSPKVLLLDEPTVGVDPQSRVRLLELVRAEARAGTCVLYTTHYMEEAETLCDRLAIMDHGKIIAAGTLADLRSMLAERDLLRLTGVFAPAAARAAIEAIAGFSPARQGADGFSPARQGADGFSPARQGGDSVEILYCDESMLSISLPNASAKLPAIFSALAQAGAEVRGTTLTQPSLESLFIKLTGKELRE